ncbi:hypothetical protein E2C01_020445 [Portunus trituberculatus]|uniref:Uncharacterized protein n=1 Tax=Portunus trituberculatus TaxID=210409 RepID=A0A5B7E1Q0_PORTR|nr:hypothetical protein [Portunus trituberculatus]
MLDGSLDGATSLSGDVYSDFIFPYRMDIESLNPYEQTEYTCLGNIQHDPKREAHTDQSLGMEMRWKGEVSISVREQPPSAIWSRPAAAEENLR